MKRKTVHKVTSQSFRKMEKRLININELSQYIGIKPQTIRNKISNGNFPIPYLKFGRLIRFDKIDVDKYIDEIQRIKH